MRRLVGLSSEWPFIFLRDSQCDVQNPFTLKHSSLFLFLLLLCNLPQRQVLLHAQYVFIPSKRENINATKIKPPEKDFQNISMSIVRASTLG